MRSLKSRKTHSEWMIALLQFMEPPEESLPYLIGMINDTYREQSAKQGTRRDRGETGTQTKLEGSDQHMPKGNQVEQILAELRKS